MLNINHINTLLPEILLIINSVTINFIIDLGATINVIDQNTFSQMQPQPQLQQTTTSIHAYQSTDTILRYPIPTIDDIIHDMNGWKTMSLLDIRKAYYQLMLSKNSRYITTFSTHSGIYRYKRMNMGINSAAKTFQ